MNNRMPVRMVRIAMPGACAAMLCVITAGCSPREASYQFEVTPRVLAATPGSSARDPRVVIDPVSSATVYVSNVEARESATALQFRISEDGGDTFEAPLTLSTPTAPVSSHGEDAPLLIHGGPLYSIWDGNGVYLARSLTWGESFEAPVRVSDGGPNTFSGYPSLAVAGSTAYAVWLDNREQGLQGDSFSIRMARSNDGGATFGPSVRLALDVCPCCRPNVSIGPGGEVMVFWRKIFPGPIHDMVVATSHDRGRTFGAPVRIAEDNWMVDGCPDSGVAVARVGSRMFAAWLTEASSKPHGVWLSWSDDAGAHWAPSVLASQQVLDANYPSMCATSEGRALLVFQGRNPAAGNGWSALGAFLVEIGPRGAVSKPMAVPNQGKSATRPTVASGSGGRAFIAWTSSGQGSSLVMLERARRR